MTSRNWLATGPGDGVDGSPLHRGPEVAAGRRRLLVVATVVALVAAGALLGGVYLVARGQYDAVYMATYEELEAIGQLREDQVAAWEGERVSDALGTAESPFFADAVTRLLADPDDAAILRLIVQQLDLALEADQSENLLLVDLDGRLLATARAHHAIVPPATRALVDSVAAPGGSARSASAILEGDGAHPHSDAAAAVRDASGASVAVVVVRSSPADTLFPRMRAWPSRSETGETLLVTREGDHAVFLSIPRLAGAAQPGSLPLSRLEVPAVRAVLGETGRFQGRDYRGQDVLTDLRAVAGTDWFLVTKVDSAEVDAEAWAMVGVTSLLALLTAVVIGGLALIAYVTRSHAIQGRLLAAERERSAAIQHHDLLTAQARDAILLLDADNRVVEANVAAETLYGCSRTELIGMRAEDFRTPEVRESMARDWADSRSSDGVLFETVHRRRDGTEVPVEVSSRVIEIDGQAYRQSIIRDITQRKAASDELRAQLDELRRWSAATVGRERRIVALKREVNELLAALGRAPRYEAELIDSEGEDA